MKVILIKSVEDLGIGGDLVDVANGYARNYLFPRNLAIKATPASIKSSESYRTKALEEQVLLTSQSEMLAEKLRGFTIEISASADESGHLYGSVTERRISDGLKEAGFEIEADQILLSEHLKISGDFPVPIKIYGDIRSEIVVKIIQEEME